MPRHNSKYYGSRTDYYRHGISMGHHGEILANHKFVCKEKIEDFLCGIETMPGR